jgi:hypothetical protein
MKRSKMCPCRNRIRRWPETSSYSSLTVTPNRCETISDEPSWLPLIQTISTLSESLRMSDSTFQ